jgi:hypothetical protein
MLLMCRSRLQNILHPLLQLAVLNPFITRDQAPWAGCPGLQGTSPRPRHSLDSSSPAIVSDKSGSLDSPSQGSWGLQQGSGGLQRTWHAADPRGRTLNDWTAAQGADRVYNSVDGMAAGLRVACWDRGLPGVGRKRVRLRLD